MWTVTVDEVLNRWIGSEPPESDDPVLTTLIEDAMVIINQSVPGLEARVTTQGDLLALLRIVTAKVVQRAYYSEYSPVSSQSQGYGPFSESYSKSDSTRQGVYILPEEVNMLSKDPDLSNSRVTVIRNPARPTGWGWSYDRW